MTLLSDQPISASKFEPIVLCQQQMTVLKRNLTLYLQVANYHNAL